MNDNDWSPWRKWWMDILKSTVVFTVVAVLTYFIVDQFQYERAARRDALTHFREASFHYQEAALDAYVELYSLYRQEDVDIRPKGESMLRYETAAYDDFRLSVENVRTRFGTNTEIENRLDELTRVNDARHEIYDQLFDLKVDGGVQFDEAPETRRAEFDTLLSNFSRNRQLVIKEIEKGLR